MAEAAVAWWEETQAWEDRKHSISEAIMLLVMRKMDKDFLSGLSEAERAAKLKKAKEEEMRLVKILNQHLHAPVKMPDFSCMTESERTVAAERLREKEQERAHLLRAQGRPYIGPEKIVSLLDFDPKQGGLYYNRYAFVDLQTFDLDEESPFGPMRCAYEIEGHKLCGAVNILSVKIASSDVGFPIHVYGTVIVRDSLDERCVYHFRRSSDHCQLINSEMSGVLTPAPTQLPSHNIDGEPVRNASAWCGGAASGDGATSRALAQQQPPNAAMIQALRESSNRQGSPCSPSPNWNCKAYYRGGRASFHGPGTPVP
nr:unnamed protein product [Digitaria exilis]